jgi:type I restriction enzyme S subunit
MNLEYKDSPLGNIPIEWDVVKLEEVCLPKEGMRRGPFGGAIKKEFFVEKGYQVYEQRNAIYDDFVSARYFIDEEKSEELKAFQIQENDFIISCSGTIGKIAKVPKTHSKGVINQALLRLRLDRTKMTDDYFLQQFRDVPFQNKITDSVQGGAMKNLVGMSEFRKTLVTLPPLQEQQKIAEILSTVDAKIEVIDQQITETQALKKGLMQQLLTGKLSVIEKRTLSRAEMKDSPLGEIPKSWEVSSLESHSAFITKGSTPTTYGFQWEESGVQFLRSECVSPIGFILSGAMFISEEANNAMERSKIQGGDILMTITGNVGRVCIYPVEYLTGNINQHIARIRITDKLLSSQFVFQFLSQSTQIQEYLKITTGQAYPQLSLKQVRETKIPIPPLKEQQKIAEILSSVDEKLEILSEKKTHYQELKQGLMQQLLTGKIRVKIKETA